MLWGVLLTFQLQDDDYFIYLLDEAELKAIACFKIPDECLWDFYSNS
jgi:hypothetical protein